eukprot:scaffold45218_cov61-Phaeocystis_antarctica.AAC.4
MIQAVLGERGSVAVTALVMPETVRYAMRTTATRAGTAPRSMKKEVHATQTTRIVGNTAFCMTNPGLRVRWMS